MIEVLAHLYLEMKKKQRNRWSSRSGDCGSLRTIRPGGCFEASDVTQTQNSASGFTSRYLHMNVWSSLATKTGSFVATALEQSAVRREGRSPFSIDTHLS